MNPHGPHPVTSQPIELRDNPIRATGLVEKGRPGDHGGGGAPREGLRNASPPLIQ